MKTIILILFIVATYSNADINNVKQKYTEDLNKVFQKNNLEAVKNLKYTEVDKKFKKYTEDLLLKKINQVENQNILSPIDLSKYKSYITKALNKKLEKGLTDNDFDFNGYKEIISESFTDGIKDFYKEKVNNIPFISKDKIKKMKEEISNIKDLSSLGDYLNKSSYMSSDSVRDIQNLNKAFNLTINAFTCVCSSQLSSAFSSIKSHIINDNLNPLYANLTSFNKTIEDNIKILETQITLIQDSNKLYKLKIKEANEYLKHLNKK